MKFRLLFLLLLSADVIFAQTRQDIFDEKVKLTWLGIDFSRARFVGEENITKNSDLQKLMESLNVLMLKERKKFDIARCMRRDTVNYALEVTMERNKTIQGEGMLHMDATTYPFLTMTDINDVAASYNYGGRDGIGVMFIVDIFNKYLLKGTLWVAFIDMKTGSVLLTNRFSSRPEGFGVRNFWASPVYATIKSIRQTDYSEWRKKYSK
jgi:hypothetical protein